MERVVVQETVSVSRWLRVEVGTKVQVAVSVKIKVADSVSVGRPVTVRPAVGVTSMDLEMRSVMDIESVNVRVSLWTPVALMVMVWVSVGGGVMVNVSVNLIDAVSVISGVRDTDSVRQLGNCSCCRRHVVQSVAKSLPLLQAVQFQRAQNPDWHVHWQLPTGPVMDAAR